MSRRTLVIVVLVVVVAAAGGFLWWYLEDDAPSEVSLDAAVESVDTTGAGDGPSGEPTDDASDDSSPSGNEGLDGEWTVDTESGEFDFESATGSFAGFRIQEELAGIGAATAVGRTGDVTGGVTFDGTTLTEASFEVDLTTITTNESRRDGRVQSALETDQFPTATFELTEPIELGAGADGGEPVSVSAVGELTIHGVTQPVEVAIEAQLVDATIVVVGSLEITFADYGVEVPSSPVVLGVEDHGTVELQLLLTR